MSGRRLPVAPRPYRDELLSSWLGRVACRYGFDAEDLVGAFTGDGDSQGAEFRSTTPRRRERLSCFGPGPAASMRSACRA